MKKIALTAMIMTALSFSDLTYADLEQCLANAKTQNQILACLNEYNKG